MSLLNNNVKSKTLHEDDIVRAHRLRKPKDVFTFSPMQTKLRPIIVQLHQFQDKLSILKACASLKPLSIGVSEDLTQRQREQLKQVPDDKHGYFRSGKLIIFDRLHRPNTHRANTGQQTSGTPVRNTADMLQASQPSQTTPQLYTQS